MMGVFRQTTADDFLTSGNHSCTQKTIPIRPKIIFLPHKIVLSCIQAENRREKAGNSGKQLEKFMRQACKSGNSYYQTIF